MVKHIVFWTLAETALGRTAEENAAEMKARLEALVGVVPGLLRLEVGTDLLRTDASADIALYAELEDRDALAAYQAHPAHVAVGELVRAVTTSRAVVDYEV